MPRGVKKENLPTKVCVTCGRPFTWRKKWERVWDEVTTCSKSCNRKRKMKTNNKTGSTDDAAAVTSDEFDSILTRLDNINHGPDTMTASVEDEASVDDNQQILAEKSNDTADIESQPSTTASTSSNDIISSSEQFPPELIVPPSTVTMDAKAQRKAEKKRKKAERRAQREGRGDPTAGQKQCTICSKSVNLLIRCTHDEIGEWGMVCGKCWNDVSGGVVDGDAAHPHYRYGGLWKNRRAQT